MRFSYFFWSRRQIKMKVMHMKAFLRLISGAEATCS